MTGRGSAASAIIGLRAYPPDRYASIDLNRLTVFTINLLNGLDVPATMENIAVADYRMFPKRFAMVGFPDYPDVARVNRALLQLRPKYRNWATGNTAQGWQLTAGGKEEARVLKARLGDNAGVDGALDPRDLEAEPSGKKKRTVHPEDTAARLRKTALFARWQAGWQGVESLEVFDALDAYTHTPAEALKHRLRRMRSEAASSGDEQVVQFLDVVAERFARLFQGR